MTHAAHIALTVVTCGLWLPVYLLCIALDAVVPTSCTVCGTPFRRNRYVWVVDGRKEHLCPDCNREMQRKHSRRRIRDRFD